MQVRPISSQVAEGRLIFHRDCFTKYIDTKVLKRLESNKIRGGYNDLLKTLLIPISFGVSSTVLLHILDKQLRNRTEQGRHAGYKLHVLFIDQSMVFDGAPSRETMNVLQEKYPSHSCATVSLEDTSEYGFDVQDTVQGGQTNLKDVVSSLTSATSKIDFVDTTRRRLILAYAEKNGCDSILFGDSTTRLAERTLSETAKGRGIALPWVTADSASTGTTCAYPLRDVLRKELLAYAGFVGSPLISLIIEPLVQAPMSSKDTTIDGLMSQYFESVEQNFPSIVANVVRTSSKLVAAEASDRCGSCSLCGNPVIDGLWGGNQDEPISKAAAGWEAPKHEKPLCYGCARTLQTN